MSKEMQAGINLYEFNKINMGKLPILKTEEEILGAKSVVIKFLEENPATYYMLLNHENRYFTLFNFKSEGSKSNAKSVMAQDVIECMEYCGFDLIDICLDEDGYALEVWGKKQTEQEACMYLLFPYDSGVIEY